jgi:uncharacterized protein DUF5926/SEC-C motif-containing protein
MGKKAARRRTASSPRGPAATPHGSAAEVPVVAGREPCPCGSGRRYKACHGREAAQAAEQFVARPFAGLPGECDWVALREIVPAATAAVRLSGEHAGRTATVATVLPMAWPGLVRQDGEVFVGLQVPGGSGDASRDVADALLRALAAEPGTPITPGALPGPGPRLQELLDPDQPLGVLVHPGFDFWIDGVEERSPEVAASMERANEAVVPTTRLESVEAAYWCDIRGRRHLRWVMPHDEDALLDAMARLHAADADRLDPTSRYVGSFRAHGVLVPVWDLDPATEAAELEEPAATFASRLAEALAETGPLDEAERRARAGLRSRQLTLR